MSKVITFSRSFPSYHYNNGKNTYFVEQILNQLEINYLCDNYLQKLLILNTVNIANGKLSFKDIENFYLSLKENKNNKLHTIRGNNKFKIFDKFSPRCWFNQPYKSPQIIFWEDIEINNIYSFEIYKGEFKINNKIYCIDFIETVALNDGLDIHDFMNWFKYPNPFNGNIICWNENIKYE